MKTVQDPKLHSRSPSSHQRAPLARHMVLEEEMQDLTPKIKKKGLINGSVDKDT